MIDSRRRLLFIGVASLASLALIAAACGGDDDDDEEATAAANTPAAAASPTTAAAETPASEETPAEETPSADGITVEAGAAGLVDGRGFSLYLFANDSAGSGTSACTGGCLTAWPALTVDGEPTAGEGVTGELGTITRDDGTTQVTYEGLPLYFFASDAAPGETNGASIPNWSLAQP